MSRGQGRRSERVADIIKEEIASMMLRGEIKDPRIGFITITYVRMTPDLKEAKVYFSQMGTKEEKEESLEGLKHATGFVRRHLAQVINLRRVPQIHFHYDDSLDYSERIETVIKEIKKGGGL